MFTPKLVYKLRKDISTVFYNGRVLPRHTSTEHFYEDTTDGAVYPSVTAMTGIVEKKHLKQWAANQAVNYMMDFLSQHSSYEPFELAEAAGHARDAHNKVLIQASEWGTEAHDLVDQYVRLWINGERPASIKDIADEGISHEAISAALAAEKFFNDHPLFPVVSEKKIVSKKYEYGGTLDTLFLIGRPQGKKSDNKKCDHIWKDHGTKGHIKCTKCTQVNKLEVLLLDLKTSNQVLGNYQYANQVGAYSQALTEMVGIKPTLHWILQVNKNKPTYFVAVVQDIKKHIKGFVLMNQLARYIDDIGEPMVPLKQKNVIKL